VNLPPSEELVETLKKWFDIYGFPVIFFSSIVEGVLLVGNYFPGAVVIFLGVALTTTISQAVVVVFVVIAGLFIAHILNYALGRYGWYHFLARLGLESSIERSREQLVKNGLVAILFSYWLPNLGALTDTAAGIIRMPFKIFFIYSLLSTILWSIFFGTLAYLLKDFVILTIVSSGDGLSGLAIVFAVTVIWIVVLLITDFFRRRKRLESLCKK